MKLYTEEQVRKAISAIYDYIDLSEDDIIKQLTPIELPSDEEIENEKNLIEPYATNDYYDGFSDGINWMKEQILNQNK